MDAMMEFAIEWNARNEQKFIDGTVWIENEMDFLENFMDRKWNDIFWTDNEMDLLEKILDRKMDAEKK